MTKKPRRGRISAGKERRKAIMRQRAMRLRDVTHRKGTESLRFELGNNRFHLFDRDGKDLNSWQIRDLDKRGADILGIAVLEVKESECVGCGVGFPVTHIRLDVAIGDEIGGEKLIEGCDWMRFGEREEEGGDW